MRIIIFSFIVLISCINNKESKNTSNKTITETPPIIAPFNDLDTLSTNDWWNRDPNPIINLNVERKDVVAFGLYTISNNTLKLTAQLFPL